MALPSSNPGRPPTSAMITEPTAVNPSAVAVSGTAPTRSGSFAPNRRTAMTTAPNTASAGPAPLSPSAVAWSGRKVRYAAMPHSPHRMITPGRRPAGWRSRPRRRVPAASFAAAGGAVGRVSGTSQARPAATIESAPATIQTPA